MKNYLLKQIFSISLYPLCFLAVAWGIFFLDSYFHLNFNDQLGTSPRTVKGLSGIIFSPFLHSNLDHIASNSIPVLVLGMLTFYFYKPIAWSVLIWIYVLAGVWLWVGGRNDSLGEVRHIGASGLIYGAATFLFFSGLFRKHKPLMVISALVLFLYGSLMWGIFPLMPGISWEAHLFGAIAGVMVAYNYRKEGPQRPQYDWENEEDNENDFYDPEKNEEPPFHNPDLNIVYHYVPKHETEDEKKEEEEKKE
jgi:membrane associated rhomboid family serine protease